MRFSLPQRSQSSVVRTPGAEGGAGGAGSAGVSLEALLCVGEPADSAPLRSGCGMGEAPCSLYTVPVIEPETSSPGDPAAAWLGALEARHLADLRPAEVGRALRALSSAYVERRDRLAKGAALDGAGKRAAFALFYGPLHFLVVRAAVRALGAAASPVDLIADLGCGTGVAGAAWALECVPRARVFGIERHPWAADEARWTCRALGLDADVRCGDLVASARAGARIGGRGRLHRQ